MHTGTADSAKANPFLVDFKFKESSLTLIEFEDQPWLIAKEMGAALGYADHGRGLIDLLGGEWKEEFIDGVDILQVTNGKLAAIKAMLHSSGNTRSVPARTPSLTLLSMSGAQLAAMKREGPEGVAFRKLLRFTILPEWQKSRQPAQQSAAPAPAPALPAPEAPPALPALSSVAARISLSLAALTHEEEAAYLIDQGDPSRLRRSPAPRDLAIGRILRLCRKSPDHLPALLSLLSRHSGQPLPSVTDAGEAPPRQAQMAQAVHLARALSTPQLVPALDTLTAAYLDTRSGRQPDPDRVALVGMCHEALLRLPPETLAEALVFVRQWGAGTARPVTTPTPPAPAPVPPDVTGALVPSPASSKEELAVRRERERRMMEAVVGRPVSAEELNELFWLEEMPWLRDGLYQVRRALHRSRRGASPARPMNGRPPMLAEEVRGSMGFSVVSWLLGLPEAELIEELAAWQQRQEKRGVRA